MMIKFIDGLGISMSTLIEISQQLSKSPGYVLNDQLTSLNKFTKYLTFEELREFGCMVNNYESQIPGIPVCSLAGLFDSAAYSYNPITINRIAKFNSAPEFKGVNWKSFNKMKDVDVFYMDRGSCNAMISADIRSHKFFQKHYSLNICYFDFMRLLNIRHTAMPIALQCGSAYSVADTSPISKIAINSKNHEVQTLQLTEKLTITVRNSAIRLKKPPTEEEIIMPKIENSENWSKMLNSNYGGVIVARETCTIVCYYCNFYVVIGAGQSSWKDFYDHLKNIHFDKNTKKLHESRCHLCSCPCKKERGDGHHQRNCRRTNYFDCVKGFFVHELPAVQRGMRFTWKNGYAILTGEVNAMKREKGIENKSNRPRDANGRYF